MSHDDDLRGFENPAQFGDGLCFSRSFHCKLFPVLAACRIHAEAAGVAPSRPALKMPKQILIRTTTSSLPPET